MSIRWVLTVLMAAGWLLAADHGWAQMFGARSFGGTLSRRPSPGGAGAEAVGTLTGRERFLRANRRRYDFVGADSTEQRSFVGRVRGRTTGPVQSAFPGFQVEQGPDANQSAPRSGLRPTNLYAPRLRVGFEVRGRSPEVIGQALQQQLAQSPAIASMGPVEVWMEGETAILRGVVASARDAELAALVAGMEPGIARVRNELTYPTADPFAAPGQALPRRPVPPR